VRRVWQSAEAGTEQGLTSPPWWGVAGNQKRVGSGGVIVEGHASGVCGKGNRRTTENHAAQLGRGVVVHVRPCSLCSRMCCCFTSSRATMFDCTSAVGRCCPQPYDVWGPTDCLCLGVELRLIILCISVVCRKGSSGMGAHSWRPQVDLSLDKSQTIDKDQLSTAT
jgi:hypothetical protein